MKNKEIRDILEHNLALVEQSTLEPVRYKDDKNIVLWNSEYQGRMDILPQVGYGLEAFSEALHRIHKRLYREGKDLSELESSIDLAERINSVFKEGNESLREWRSREIGFWKRAGLRMIRGIREDEDSEMVELVRRMLKLPLSYSAHTALIYAGYEFERVLSGHNITLVKLQDYEVLVHPCPIPGYYPPPSQHYDQNRIVPVVSPDVALEALNGAGFAGELKRRSKLNAPFKAYNINTPLTSI